MIKWLRFILWNPLELLFTKFPIIPLKVELIHLDDEIIQIKIHNIVTRAISKFGGGYDYSVMYLVGNKLLIDTGFSWAKRSFKKFLLESGYDKTITTVINSHAHEDHMGNNDVIEKFTNAKIYAHYLAIPTIKHPPKLPWYRSFMFGSNTFSNVEEISGSICFEKFEFQAIHTPGHSAGHICLFEKNKKWLFSGDLYVAPDLDSQLQDVNGPDWINSLERVIPLNSEILFDGHGVIVNGKDEVYRVLSNKLIFLKQIRDKVLKEAISPMHLETITQKIFGDKTFINSLSFNDGWLSILTSSDFSRTNLVRSFINHPNNKSVKNESN